MNEEVGLAIQRLRQAEKLSQSELAKLAGTSQQHISRIEKGKQVPGLDILFGISKALRITPDVILREAGFIPEKNDLTLNELERIVRNLPPEGKPHLVSVPLQHA